MHEVHESINLTVFLKKLNQQVREDIYRHWDKQYTLGHFDTIKDEVQDKNYQWSFPVQWDGPTEQMLNYQEPPPEGKTTGRYIGCDDKGDVVDVHIPTKVTIHDGRQCTPQPPSLDNEGFQLVNLSSSMKMDALSNEKAGTLFLFQPLEENQLIQQESCPGTRLGCQAC